MAILKALCLIFIFPYYRTLMQRTVDPALAICKETDKTKVAKRFDAWIRDKAEEFSEVKAAGALSAGGSVAMVSSQFVHDNTVWYALALWSSALILAIFAVIGGAQEQMLLGTMRSRFQQAFPLFGKDQPKDQPKESYEDGNHDAADFMDNERHFRLLVRYLFEPRKPKGEFQDEFGGRLCEENWKLSVSAVFIWQTPLMLMSYSWVFFILALSLHTMRPFLPQQDRIHDSKVAIFYLVFAGLCIVLFFFCGLWPVWYASSGQKANQETIEQEGRANGPIFAGILRYTRRLVSPQEASQTDGHPEGLGSKISSFHGVYVDPMENGGSHLQKPDMAAHSSQTGFLSSASINPDGGGNPSVASASASHTLSKQSTMRNASATFSPSSTSVNGTRPTTQDEIKHPLTQNADAMATPVAPESALKGKVRDPSMEAGSKNPEP